MSKNQPEEQRIDHSQTQNTMPQNKGRRTVFTFQPNTTIITITEIIGWVNFD